MTSRGPKRRNKRKIAVKELCEGFSTIPVADLINWKWFRKAWLESARQTSLGILLFSFSARTWDYPQTLGSIIDTNPKIKKRFDRWVNAKKPSFPNCLMGERLAYMLRK